MKKLSHKIILPVTIIILLLVTSLVTVSIYMSGNNIRRESRDKLENMSANYANEFSNELNKATGILDTFYSYAESSIKIESVDQDVYMQQYKAEASNFIEKVLKNNEGVLGAYIYFNPEYISGAHDVYFTKDSAGNITRQPELEESAYDPNAATMDWFYRPFEEKSKIWTDFYQASITDYKLASYTKALVVDGKHLATVGIDLNFEDVKNIIESINPYETGFAYIMNENNNFLIHPFYKNKESLSDIGLEKEAELMNKNQSGVFTVEYRGIKMFNGYAKLSNGWIMGVTAPEAEVMARVLRTRNYLIIIAFILIFLTILSLYFISKKISNPIKEITSITKKIGDGNLEVQIPEKQLEREDELGILAKSVDNMAEEISASYQQLEAYNQEITALNEELSYQAYHDPLTEISNRRKMINFLEKELKKNSSGALVLLDINSFKDINDNYGHIYGDQLLYKIAQRILEYSSSDNVSVARYGGDEFLILIKDSNLEEIEKEILKIRKISNNHFTIKANKVYINFVLGIALYPQDSKTVDQLITKADIAMYEAKKRKKKDYLYYDQFMVEQLKRQKMIKDKLKKALKNDGFKLKYQPQINLETGKADYVEALIRLKESKLSPAEFIPVAEESGLIIEIGRWVTKEAIKKLALIKNVYLSNLKISINFSANQINDTDYINFLRSMLKKYNVDASSLEIEITESFLIEDNKSIDFINELKKLGVKIALDDFGTGYSSFSYLGYLNADKVKLDKLLSDNFINKGDVDTLFNLINLLHSLDLSIVAEGIETKEQYLKLKESRCNHIQGYLFSKPKEKEELRDIIEKNYISKENVNF